jgi:outer membrane protein TolC
MKNIKLLSLSTLITSVFFLNIPIYAQEKLAWEDCVKTARNNNPSLISAKENIAQKKSALDIAASPRYPSLDSNAAVDRSQTKSTGTLSDKQTSYSYGISASQTIFDGFKTTTAIKSSRENIKAAGEQYRFVSAQARHDLRLAFIDVLKYQELINELENIVKIRTTDVAMIKLRYASGLEHIGSLLTAQASLSSAKYEVNQAKRNLILSKQNLAVLMGIGNSPVPSVKETFDLPAIDKAPDFAALAAQHPSINEAANSKNIARLNIDSARADFFPQVNADASLTKNGTVWPPVERRANYGLRLDLPLFEGGLRQARLQQSRAAYRQSQADERIASDSVIIALQRNWLAMENAYEAAAVQKEILAATLERSKIAEAQYSNGFITFDNWTIIQDGYINSKKAYLTAQANALYAQADWQFAKGETLEYGQD